MTYNLFYFFVLGLAAWRLASLVANENGPFHFFLRLRRNAARLERRFWIVREFHLYEGMTCEWCNSIWFGIAFYIFWSFFGDTFVKITTPLALSTIAIILKYVVQGLQQWNDSFKKDETPLPQTEQTF